MSIAAEALVEVNSRAPEAEVFDPYTGKTVLLSSLWQQNRAMLVFLRHLGCTFCREQVSELRDALPEFAQRKVTMGLITLNSAAETARFCQERLLQNVPAVCLADPDRNAYRAYGLARGITAGIFTPHVFARGIQSTLHGHFSGVPHADPFQMPGVFLVDSTGLLQYAYRAQDASDNPPVRQLLEVLDRC